ncbi:hypothetical protein F66182_4742 [Fusarium sp. NRRL 66182]|nr:hypothetical protein F66182_4742 [Fusarium sp. NRRL 66182]
MLPITTCVVAGQQYLIHPLILGSIQETIKPDAIIPVTLLSTDEIFGDVDGVLKLLDDRDDVFVADFGSVLVEKPGDSSSEVPAQPQGAGARKVYHVNRIRPLDSFADLPSGPYFLHGPNLHQAWRLYDDEFGAFTFGVVPDDLANPDEFQSNSHAVPVPSRLYHPKPSIRKPLSGTRISISDTMSLKGTRTTLSSRAWESLYKETSNSTAPHVQRLLDQGAVIVGKTKIPQFGTGAEWVDQQAPWSARGDGYHIMKGTAIGAAAASAGYEWLDHSFGLDSGGVVTERGIYSFVSSNGDVSTDDTKITNFDRTSLFSRSLESLLSITASSLDTELHDLAFPTRILIPTDFASGDTQENNIIGSFAMNLGEILRVEPAYIHLATVWDMNPPPEAEQKGLEEYMQYAYFWLWYYENYHAFKDFRTEYQQKFYKKPFIDPTLQEFWDQCKLVTRAQYHEALERLNVYRRWFREFVMRITPTINNTIGDTILVIPYGNSRNVEHRNKAVAVGGASLVISFYANTVPLYDFWENRVSAGSTPRATSPAPPVPVLSHPGSPFIPTKLSMATSRPRVLHIGDPIQYNPETYLRFTVQFEVVRPSTEERQRPAFIKALKERRWGDFDAIFRPFWGTGGEMGKWDNELISLLPESVRVFASAGAGFDWADTKLLGERGIIYCNSGLAAAEAVADFAIIGIISTFRLLPWCISSALSGDEQVFGTNHRDATMQSFNLRDQALGLVGFGNIGQQIAARARHGFGMDIHYYDVLPKPAAVVAPLRATHHETLESLLSRCDCTVLCTPAGDGTLINATTLPLFKRGSRFVNIARGSLVDEDALVAALEDGQLSNAALDVHANEPKIHPGLLELGKQGRVLLTCHNAGGTVDTHKGFEELSMRNIMAVLGGGEAVTPVNLQYLKK